MNKSVLTILKLSTVLMLILTGCGSDGSTSVSDKSTPKPTVTKIPTKVVAIPTTTKDKTITPAANSSQQQKDKAAASTATKQGNDKKQVAGLPYPTPTTIPSLEILHKFQGSGRTSTETFVTNQSVKLGLEYKGGPISVGLLEDNPSPRSIYGGPVSDSNSYKSRAIDAGSYGVVVTCEGPCQWTITIESSGTAATSTTQKSKATKDTDESSTVNGSRSQSNQKAIPEIVKAEWDVFESKQASKILSAPKTGLITLNYDSTRTTTNVSGAAGSVPSEAHVMVANLELGDFVVVAADDNGSFDANISGHPGTHIMVKQDTTRQIFNVENPAETHGPNTLRTIFPPGVLMPIPMENNGGGLNFSSAGRLSSDQDAPWTIDGSASKKDLTLGQSIPISGTVSIRTGKETPPSNAKLDFQSEFLINSSGRQVGGSRIFTTNLFTPTNLPIESKGLLGKQYRLGEADLEWQFDGDNWTSDFSTTLTPEDSSPRGLHLLKASLSGVSNLPRKGSPHILQRSFLQEASLGTMNIGETGAMTLTSTLLADELSEGSRGGVISREDLGVFDIVHRAGVRHQPVVPRLDGYGKSWRYRLEPYVPLLGVVDRAPPAAPSIKFDFASSSLKVTVLRPDGKTDTLGPAPLAKYAVKSPRTPWHKTVSEGGGNLGEVPQLQSDVDAFNYEFPTDGDYVVTLNGEIKDIFGRTYSIAGTYDITVANVLDIETNILPGTPLDVGDSFPAGLRIMPGLPATIDFTITHVGSDGISKTDKISGKANDHGWWDGDGYHATFNQHGEYRLDVEARYSDSSDNLWVGRMSFGSVIATENAPMILHGRRGPNRVAKIPKPWGFTSDFADTNADHIQFPYFTGDVMWGKNKGNLADSVAVLTSLQLVDDGHPLIARIKENVEDNDGISASELIKVGQVPIKTEADLVSPEAVDLWSYVYASVQRPGIRVREHVLGDDSGGTYWRFDDAYHMQSGNGREGDLPGDFKFMYAGAAITDPKLKTGVYASYGSGWVLSPDSDPMGARFMPPFQGAAGGPDGGPLFKVHDSEVDIFFMPLAVRPGAILEVGDTFRMAGPIMPTLDSYVKYRVESPSGEIRAFEGRANSIGYFYDPNDDLLIQEPGLWNVNLSVTHAGLTSAGLVEAPYPKGGPLTPNGSFSFVVKDSETEILDIKTDLSDLTPAEWFSNVRNARFEAKLPTGFSADSARVIVTMPGIVLVDKEITADGDELVWELDAEALNSIANNFDYKYGIADTIQVTFYAKGSLNGKSSQATGTMVTHGARVPTVPKFEIKKNELPELSSFITNKTDRFIVDLEYVTGGHPFKGLGANDPDDGAHVNWDNSSNRWPESTPVTEYPAIYAVADGYVEAVNTYEPVGGGNFKYSIHYFFAQKNGSGVKVHMSIEPSMNPGDSSFYEPFIKVKKGQSVRKGDIIAYMYLEPNGDHPGPHIHFSIQPEGHNQQVPAIFTDKILDEFYPTWGIFRFDRQGSPSDSDVAMPKCWGYKITASENPYGSGASDCFI